MKKKLSVNDRFSMTGTTMTFNTVSLNKLCVYVSCPMALGDRRTNMLKGIDMAQTLLEKGYCPFVPSLHFTWGDEYPDNSYDTWLAMDLVWVGRCDALIYLPGLSRGVENEIKFAEENGIPVFSNVEDLDKWAASRLEYIENHAPTVQVGKSVNGANKAYFEYMETAEGYSQS